MHLTQLIEETAGKIRSLFEHCPDGRLPSNADLSRQFAVSPRTITKALHLLRERNLVEVLPKRRARIREVAPSPPPIVPVARLYRDLREQLLSTRIQPGQVLPKRAAFLVSHGLSPAMTGRIYRRLCAEGLITRRGNAYVAGLPMPKASGTGLSPVIGVAMPLARSWRVNRGSRRSGSFFGAFQHSIHQVGYRLAPLVCPENAGASMVVGRWHAGLAARKEVYAGALVMGEQNASWARDAALSLAALDRPVVWFDRNDTGWGTPTVHRHISRCHYSEDHLCRAALEWLRDQGHGRAGFVLPTDEPWQRRRLALLTRMGKSTDPPLEIIPLRRSPRDWLHPVASGIAAGIRSLPPGPSTDRLAAALSFFVDNHDRIMDAAGHCLPPEIAGHPDEALYAFVCARLSGTDAGDLTPAGQRHVEVISGIWSLRECLYGDYPLPALIAPNDAFALSVLASWLDGCRLKAPDDLDVISFDNRDEDLTSWVTSVDPGFETLGRAAAAIITGTARIGRSRAGDCAVRPFVVERRG